MLLAHFLDNTGIIYCMALKLTVLMSHIVGLTLSTRMINHNSSSHSFSLSLALFTFLNRQENSHDCLSTMSGKTYVVE